MIQVIGYFLACLILAAFLTLLVSMCRSVKTTDEFRTGRCILKFFFVLALAPYLLAEILTRTVGKNLDQPILAGLDDIEFKGKLAYYRVVFMQGDSLRVIVVGDEGSVWDKATERPIIAFKMVRDGSSWKVKESSFINSNVRDKDGISIPPYW